jgi:hypothetical protein
LPPGAPNAALLRGPGVLDVLPSQLPHAAVRIGLMANVPFVAPRGRAVAHPAQPAHGAAVAARPAMTAVSHAVDHYGPSPAPLRKAVAIASSTGGCWLAAEMIRAFPRGATGPILLAQHMDDEFVGFFAGWVESTAGPEGGGVHRGAEDRGGQGSRRARAGRGVHRRGRL